MWLISPTLSLTSSWGGKRLVREVLVDLGAEVLDPRIVVTGMRWSEQLAGWLNDVDAVVAVLTGSRGGRNESVLVEVGIALGRGLPLLVLRGDEPAPVPLDLADVLSVRTGLQNVEAIEPPPPEAY
jgi:hypothetical protein